MTRVTLSADYMGEKGVWKYRVECEGHATGSDMCCFAAGQLMQMLAYWLQQGEENVETWDVLVKSGHAYATFCGHGDVFSLICCGFEQLENTFPGFLKIFRNF